jgi:hypothetical protein
LVDDATEAQERHTLAAELKPRRQTIWLLGRDIPAIRAGDGTLRTKDDGKPAYVKSLQGDIARALDDRLAVARAATEGLAATLAPEELKRIDFELYEQFRASMACNMICTPRCRQKHRIARHNDGLYPEGLDGVQCTQRLR